MQASACPADLIMQTPFGGYSHNSNRYNHGLIESYCEECHDFIGASQSEFNLSLAETAHRSDCKASFNSIREKSSRDGNNRTNAFRLLSLGHDATLMLIRTTLLRKAGYAVIETHSCEAALQGIESSHIDLLLICHSVPAREQDAFVGRVRSLRPKLPIVCLDVAPSQPLLKGCVPACSFALEFLDDVNQVLRRA